MHTACFWSNLQYYFNLCFTPIWYLGVRVYVLYNVYVIRIYLRVPVSKTIFITNDGGMFWQPNDECHYEIMPWLESSAVCLVKHYIIISHFVLFDLLILIIPSLIASNCFHTPCSYVMTYLGKAFWNGQLRDLVS